VSNYRITVSTVVLLLGLNQISCHSGHTQQTEDTKIVNSLRRKIEADLKAHKTQRDIWAQTGNDAGWVAEQDDVLTGYSLNVEKTTSLVSPYLGTAEFRVTGNLSSPKNSSQEAREATDLGNSYSVNHRVIYAYQNEEWVLKSEECYDYNRSIEAKSWSICASMGGRQHGAHLDFISIP